MRKEKGERLSRIEKKKINIKITHSRIENADARKKNKRENLAENFNNSSGTNFSRKYLVHFLQILIKILFLKILFENWKIRNFLSHLQIRRLYHHKNIFVTAQERRL